MREIKFRGLGENGWVYGDLFSAWAVGGIHPRIHWVEGVTSYNQGVKPETVGEFTGLKDFYEGDLVQCLEQWVSKEGAVEEENTYTLQVRLANYEWQFVQFTKNEYGVSIPTLTLSFSEYRKEYSWGDGIEKHLYDGSRQRFRKFVCVGNIHENPELAEKEISNGDTVQD